MLLPGSDRLGDPSNTRIIPPLNAPTEFLFRWRVIKIGNSLDYSVITTHYYNPPPLRIFHLKDAR